MINFNNKKINKKAWVFPVFLVVVTLVAFTSILIIFSSNINDFYDKIGTSQVIVTNATFNSNKALFYLDKSAEYSLINSIFILSENGGYKNNSKCKKALGFNLWNCENYKTYGSFPQKKELQNTISNFLIPKLDLYLENNPFTIFPKANYHLFIDDNNYLEGHSFFPLSFSSQENFLINYDNVPSTDILTNWDYTNANQEFFTLSENFAKQFHGLNYVRAGISPYTYSTAKQKQSEGDLIFKGIYLLNNPPGFDCSGFVWWCIRHMDINIERTTAEKYYLVYAKNYGQMICDSNTNKKCTKTIIENEAKNGDILFIDPCTSRAVCHIGIYKENNQIIHSRGSKGLVIEQMPDNYWPGKKNEIVAVYRFNFDLMRQKMPLSSKSTAPHQELASEIIHKKSSIAKPQDDFAFDYSTDYLYYEYQLKPNFKINIGYNFSIYDKLREDSVKMVSSCVLNDNIKECVDNQIKQLNSNQNKDNGIIWSNVCGSSDEYLFYELYDQFNRCFMTLNDSCYCKIEINNNEIFKDYKIIFNITNENNNVSIINNEGIKELISKDFNLFYFDLNNNYEITLSNNYKFSFIFRQNNLQRFFYNINNKEHDFNNYIYIIKKNNQFILADNNYIIDYFKNNQDTFECVIPNKDNFRFCVTDNTQKFPVIDNDKIEMMPLTYNFALTFFK
jgi:hypothetical protein